MNEKLFLIVGIIGLVVLLVACEPVPGANGDGLGINISEIIKPFTAESGSLKEFSSCSEISAAFEKARQEGNAGNYFAQDGMFMKGGIVAMSAESAAPQSSGRSFSETNIQVEGVDEADIIKTDGDYIYAVASNQLHIVRAYPVEKAKIVSTIDLKDFYPQELFIHKDRMLVFGTSNQGDIRADYGAAESRMAPEIYPSPRYFSVVSVKLYDISDKEDPELLRTMEFEGSYVSSRKIGSDVYFVVNSYPSYSPHPCIECIVPLYRENTDEFKPAAGCADVSYIEPLHASNFITVAAISMTDEDRDVEKEVIVGNGQNIYASPEYLYIAQSSYSRHEETVVSKFELKDGKIKFVGNGDVPGHILNQFAMDEYNGNFRIATTISGYSGNKDTSTNNIYVLDKGMDVIGKIEKIAPGESIYAARFMGNRCYLVTFRHVDPLFVIDLSNPENPEVLGKLKIPGYSEYLHPYDETHLIGIGKEVDASIDADKIHTENAVYYTAIQGVKLAIFDVSDVEHPIEMYKEVIGDRGTESEAATNHKAFLFDKEKGLLVIPVTVAELPEGAPKNEQGEFVFQGAYVYDLSLKDGFNLKGKVTHYDSDDAFKKSGEYFFMDEYSIKRSLYIEDVLYTLSNSRIQLNSLDDADTLKAVDFPESEKQNMPPYEVAVMR